ncbi:hypothetical protein [Streptomyces sp. NPDC001970]
MLGRGARDVRAEAGFDQGQRQVNAGGDTGRGDEAPVPYEDRVTCDTEHWPRLRRMIGRGVRTAWENAFPQLRMTATTASAAAAA